MHFQCLMKGHEFTAEEARARQEHADEVFGLFTDVANRFGYAIARHGSQVRDIDLVAVPWTADAITATELALKLSSMLVLTMGHYGYDKPHGRAAFAMWEPDWPDHQIDLSVMPIVVPTSEG